MIDRIKGKNDLQYALSLLASSDDGATSRDAKGFNKNDTEKGNRLAGIPQVMWDIGTQKEVLLMLKKYKKQLQRKGLDYNMDLWGYFWLEKVRLP